MVMITVNKPVQVRVTTMEVYMKVRDEFDATFKTSDGETVLEYSGYVPDFMPGQHSSEYVILTIDIASGKILNWKPIGQIEGEMRRFFNNQQEIGNI